MWPYLRWHLSFMSSFQRENYDFLAAMLESLGVKKESRVRSVHVALGMFYLGEERPDLHGEYVLALPHDQFKGAYDFAGGCNDTQSGDAVWDVLKTFLNELYEELAFTPKRPFEDFVLEVLQCGPARDPNKNLLFVCGINGLCAEDFRQEMRKKHSIRPRLPTCYLEMDGMIYMGKGDRDIRSRSTSYVQQQSDRVFKILESSGRFPMFHHVATIGKRSNFRA